MARYIGQRILLLVPILVGMSVIVFALAHLAPGDPISVMFGVNERGVDPKVIAQLKAQYGLNDPLPVQYVRFLSRAVRGDLGRSITTGRPVFRSILERMPATLQLTLGALAISLSASLPLGILSALKRNSFIDHFSMLLALVGVSMPSFWLGLMLILLFGLYLGWLPTSGIGHLRDGPWDVFKHALLPSLTLGLALAGLTTRLTRSSMLEVLGQDYIRTARAKGLREKTVILRHGLKNALIPVVTIVGLQFAGLLGGTVIIETVFAWPGVGRLAINAIWRRDYPMIQGTVLMLSILFVLINLAVDVLYTLLDPRIRYDSQ